MTRMDRAGRTAAMTALFQEPHPPELDGHVPDEEFRPLDSYRSWSVRSGRFGLFFARSPAGSRSQNLLAVPDIRQDLLGALAASPPRFARPSCHLVALPKSSDTIRCCV